MHCMKDGKDICEETARFGDGESKGPCSNRDGRIGGTRGMCDVGSLISPKTEFTATHAKKTYTSSGCVSKSIGPRVTLPGGGIGPRLLPGGGIGPRSLSGNGNAGASNRNVSYGYTWTTAIRIVGIGQDFD
jgi:hypothetical protein